MRVLFSSLLLFVCFASCPIQAGDPLPSWNEGPAKQAVMDFVRKTTTAGSAEFVPPSGRIATFDQDGTLWVEQPVYPQVVYGISRLGELVKEKPELKEQEPFKTALSGDLKAVANLPMEDLVKILTVTGSGMSVDRFRDEVQQWLASARDERWKRPFTALVYQPMQEVMEFLRGSGFKTYIVTGSGQGFVRVYSEETYGVPPEQVIGSASRTTYGYDRAGKPFLQIEPEILLNNNFAGKPEDIHLVIGRRPVAAFGNSTGDRQMLEYTKSGGGLRLAMIVLHDDAEREYAYGPAEGLPASNIGTFTQKLYDEAGKSGWVVISMKNDWKHLFSFDVP